MQAVIIDKLYYMCKTFKA